MSKQLNVNLNFSANTSQAKMQIQELQTSLNNLIAGSVSNKQLPITKELIQAQTAASSLKVALDSAINTQTGKLDLSKFSNSLGNAGLSLKTLQTQLQGLGPAGAQTFQSLATSIMQAEVPLTRSNALVGQLWTTLKNTARWQISSSILHGFIKTLHGAIGYAKDLNQSLNNIRIVTGQSVDDMARFAEQANKAARALNTTTTDYTKASLIFYQQGLSDSEVQARTDVVIKMANVTRQNAEIVSDQLTAVWNNFYDGSESLESFADKMVALGAATASSSDEIAGGLEKFAAIGDTIGLSFDYAAAALATITSNTRASEEVVGTALKTIFARIQGLSLGETLEDGTDLNKYSEALQSVGIDIKDQNGELKKMDTILDEMGNKWGTLNKDQQAALAQTVAGVRQYTQLVSLMDNWNSGDRDSFQANLDTIDSSDGALQKQADIFAESWEAARKRVKAAAEDIYDSLLNDEFIIILTNGFAKFLDLIGTFIDSIGGLPGTLALLGTLMTKVFGEQMAASLQRLAYNVRSFYGANQAAAQQLKQEAYNRASNMNYKDGTESGAATNQVMNSQLKLQNELLSQQKLMTKEEYARYEKLIEINKAYGDQAIAAAKAVDAARGKTQDANREVRRQALAATNPDGTQTTTNEQYQDARLKMKTQSRNAAGVDATIKKLNKEIQNGDVTNYEKQIKRINGALITLGKNNATANSIRKLNAEFKSGQIDQATYRKELNRLVSSGELLDDAMVNIADGFRDSVPGVRDMTKEVDTLAQEEMDLAVKSKQLDDALKNQKAHTDEVKNAIAGFKSAMSGFSATLVTACNGISQMAMGISSLKSVWDTFNNSDMSFGEKFMSITMSMAMAIPALIGGYQALFIAQEGHKKSTMTELALGAKDVVVKSAQAVWNLAVAAAKGILTAATSAETVAVWANNAAWYANPIMWIAIVIIAVIAAIVALVAWIINMSTALSDEEQAAKKAEQAAKELSEGYDNCKAAYEEMIETMSQYEEARESLKQLTKGTEEYQEALKEANRAALELLQANPGKFEAGVDYTWEDGELVISDEAMDRVKDEGEKEVARSYAAMQMGQAEEREAKVAAEAAALATEIDTASIDEDEYKSAINNARKKYVEDQNLFTNKEYMAGALGMDMNDSTQKEIIDALWANRDEMIKLGDATTNAANSYTLATQAAVTELLAGNKNVEESESKQEILNKSAEVYDKAYQNALKELDDYGDGTGWGEYDINQANGANDEAKKVFAEYAQAAGITGATLTDTTGDDDNRMFVYVNSEGDEKTVSLEAMRIAVATQRATQKVEGNADKLVAIADKFEDNIELAGKDTQAGNSMTMVKDAIFSKNFDNFTNGTDFMAGVNAMDLSADEIKALGYNGQIDYIMEMSKLIQEAEAARQQTVNSWNMSMDKAYEGTSQYFTEGLNQLTNAQLQQVDQLSKALQMSVGDLLSGDTNAQDLLALNEALASVDFSAGIVKAEDLGEAYKNLGAEAQQAVDKFLELQNKLSTYETGLAKVKATTEKLDKSYSEFEENVGDDEVLEQYYRNLAKNMNVTTEKAKELAKKAVLAAKGLKELGENIEDYNILTKKGSENTVEYAKAMVGLRNTLLDIYGVEVSDDFLKGLTAEDLSTLKQAAEGSEEALESFRKKIREEARKQVLQVAIELNDQSAINQLNSIMDTLQRMADAKEITPEIKLQTAQAMQQLQNLLTSGKASADGIQAYFNAIGWDAQIHDHTVPISNVTTFTGELGGQTLTGTFTTKSEVSVPVIGDGKVKYLKDQNGAASGSYNDVVVAAVNSRLAQGGSALRADLTSQEGIDLINEVVGWYGGGAAQLIAEQNGMEVSEVHAAFDNNGIYVQGPSQEWQDQQRVNAKAVDVGNIAPYTGDSGGGGGGDKKDKEKAEAKIVEPTEKKTLDEEIERYYEINEVLDDLNRELDEIGKKKDEAWGANKIAQMDKELSKLKQLSAAQKQYGKEIANNLIKDKAAAEAIGAIIDPTTGRITNYDEVMTQLVNNWNSTNAALDTREQDYENAVADASNMEDGEGKISAEKANEAEKTAIDKARDSADKAYESAKKALEQYTETLNLSEEAQVQLEEYARQIRELNYEKIQYKLELKLTVNENELKQIEYYLGKIEGKIEKVAEVYGLLLDQQKNSTKNLQAFDEHYKDLTKQYEDGQINEASYIEGLQETYDSIYDNLNAIYEIDERMKEYYGETYDLALEKIEKYTTQMEHLNGVLEHYKSIMGLLGKETDNEAMGILLAGQVETTRNKFDTSNEIFNMAKQQMDDAKQALDNAIDENAKEVLQANYDKAVEQFNNAQEQMLADAEAYGQAIRDVLVNSMQQAAKDMEKALSGTWGTFEALQEQMSLHSAREEEYLTTTNKLYETNKMLNQLAQDMEKTDNRAAKQKYSAFAKEIEQLQEKEKLSNLELQIAQAKYEVLQAQIALEEAQNAKSNVRLTRDEEGNYGYVYTADQDKVSQAEQQLADAENELYNTQLEAANEYAEKIIQAKNDLNARLVEIDQKAAEDTYYRETQYAADRERIISEYYATIETYQELYGIATEGDAKVVQDAWTSAYTEVINQGEGWKNAIVEYTGNINTAFSTWESETDRLTTLVGEDLDETKTKVGEVTTASGELKDKLIQEVIPAAQDALTAAQNLTGQYALERTAVLELAGGYEQLARDIRGVIEAKAELTESEQVEEEPEETEEQQETTPTNTEVNNTENNGDDSQTQANQLASDAMEIIKKVHNGTIKQDSSGWRNNARAAGYSEDAIALALRAFNESKEGSGYDYFYDKALELVQGYDTGGYTGNWGPEGKLAFLHEKELVLNADDTKNFLASTEILREISQMLDTNALIASLGAINLHAMAMNSLADQVLQQEVTIHADFPNVSDHNEIEIAIDNLINAASQHAYKI